MKEMYASATFCFGDFGVYNGWYTEIKDAKDIAKSMNIRLPEYQWVIVKKSEKKPMIYWKDFDLELFYDFLKAGKT